MEAPEHLAVSFARHRRQQIGPAPTSLNGEARVSVRIQMGMKTKINDKEEHHEGLKANDLRKQDDCNKGQNGSKGNGSD